MSVETPAHALECKVGLIAPPRASISKLMLKPSAGSQAWWADRILQGKKTIEVRQYPLPQQLLGELAMHRVWGCTAWVQQSCWENKL